jgi:hypothetical protein
LVLAQSEENPEAGNVLCREARMDRPARNSQAETKPEMSEFLFDLANGSLPNGRDRCQLARRSDGDVAE